MYRAITAERQRLAEDLKSKHLEISEQYSIVPGNVTDGMIKNFLGYYERKN